MLLSTYNVAVQDPRSYGVCSMYNVPGTIIQYLVPGTMYEHSLSRRTLVLPKNIWYTECSIKLCTVVYWSTQYQVLVLGVHKNQTAESA